MEDKVEVITSETFDDWSEVDSQKKEVTSTPVSQTLTSGIKKMLYEDSSEDIIPVKREENLETLPQLDSIYEQASALGMTVQEWVQDDTRHAIFVAEHTLAEWQGLLTQAAATGGITMADSSGTEKRYAVTKNQTQLIEVRVNEAIRQLAEVNEYALTAFKSNEQRRHTLERAMYKRALKGDGRMAIYLHDRVEGRPAETKQVELDYDNAYNIYAVIKTLFDKQLEVLNSGSGVRLICCSRRAGKTHLLVAIMMIECLRRPRTTVMYVGETMELSEALVDKAAQDIIDACQLKNKRGMRFDWRHFDNGSQIIIRGLSNTKDPDQIRGKAAKVIVIDEFFHLKSELLEYMQREVLEPMQMDYADDYMFICAGTPPKVKGTYGEQVWKTWDVPHFSWTWRNNPHPVSVEAREKFVEKVLRDKGLDWSSTFARREYNGEWAYDDDLLLYPEYHTYNIREAVPNLSITRVVFGIDYGVGDNDTLVGIAWSDDQRRGFQFWEEKFNRLDLMNKDVSQLEYLCGCVKRAWEYALDFFPSLPKREANKRILWDADDNDQHLTDHMNINIKMPYVDEETGERKDLKLNIQNAHKTDKVIMFDKIRDILRTGDLLVMENSKLEKEIQSTILKRGPNGEVYSEVDMKAYHPDLLPAMRYALWNCIGIDSDGGK